ncbi:MAG: hypothetical protein LBL84_00880 [Candidatus Nomurabacteria bacterium]|jgi:predicted Zn-dependent protease|nr:hypothetical protein [Candidatus Nomurabacteria bacterium]
MKNIVICHDSGLSSIESQAVNMAAARLANMVPNRVLNYGSQAYVADSSAPYSSPDWYIRSALRLGDQIYAGSLLQLLIDEPYQRASPHIDLFVASHDLTDVHDGQWLNYCFGSAQVEWGVDVQSVYRFRSVRDTALRQGLIVWVILHEVGHLLGMAADQRRSNTEYKLGLHCTNRGCVMQQSMSLTEAINHVRDAGGEPRYCPQCLQDMQNHGAY